MAKLIVPILVRQHRELLNELQRLKVFTERDIYNFYVGTKTKKNVEYITENLEERQIIKRKQGVWLIRYELGDYAKIFLEIANKDNNNENK